MGLMIVEKQMRLLEERIDKAAIVGTWTPEDGSEAIHIVHEQVKNEAKIVQLAQEASVESRMRCLHGDNLVDHGRRAAEWLAESSTEGNKVVERLQMDCGDNETRYYAWCLQAKLALEDDETKFVRGNYEGALHHKGDWFEGFLKSCKDGEPYQCVRLKCLEGKLHFCFKGEAEEWEEGKACQVLQAKSARSSLASLGLPFSSLPVSQVPQVRSARSSVASAGQPFSPSRVSLSSMGSHNSSYQGKDFKTELDRVCKLAKEVIALYSNPDLAIVEHKEAVDESDKPGIYEIICTAELRTSQSRSSYKIGSLLPMTEVEVLEVVRVMEDQRVRGKIKHPEGWISLLNISDGFRWAKQKEAKFREDNQH